MNEIKLSTSNSSLNYYPEERKSFLKLNDTKYHVYQNRNIFTWVGYVLKKYLSFGSWKERSLTIGDQNYKFLVHSKNLNAVDNAIKNLAAKVLNTSPQTWPQAQPTQTPTWEILENQGYQSV